MEKQIEGLVPCRNPAHGLTWRFTLGSRAQVAPPEADLKDRLGPRWQEAIVLSTGEHAYRHGGWIWILPLSQLWA